MQAYQSLHVWKYGVLGLDVLPYQLALGVSFRIFERGLYFRLYFGPFKLFGGVHK